MARFLRNRCELTGGLASEPCTEAVRWRYGRISGPDQLGELGAGNGGVVETIAAQT